MTRKPVSAKEAYTKYSALAGTSPRMMRRMELTRILAERRPSAEPNLKYRLSVADRFIRIHGVK